MILGRLLIFNENPERRIFDSDLLRGHGYEVIDAALASGSVEVHPRNPDLVLLHLSSGINGFTKVADVYGASGTPIALIIERGFSAAFRKDLLALKADGFINSASPIDEWVASIDALIRKKRMVDDLKHIIGTNEIRQRQSTLAPSDRAVPLRDRLPELYREILGRYEAGVKLVLQHRIYKISDDAFEPFRQIARQLFLADATARDAVQLHYQTLRKIAPSMDTPGAQAYLEVGRTTIIGLMGDLLTYYRDGDRHDPLPTAHINDSTKLSTKQK